MIAPQYRVGSIIEYGTFGDQVRRVRVTDKLAEVKNGEPGFDGQELNPATNTPVNANDEFGVWGYDRQITKVVTF